MGSNECNGPCVKWCLLCCIQTYTAYTAASAIRPLTTLLQTTENKGSRVDSDGQKRQTPGHCSKFTQGNVATGTLPFNNL